MSDEYTVYRAAFLNLFDFFAFPPTAQHNIQRTQYLTNFPSAEQIIVGSQTSRADKNQVWVIDNQHRCKMG